MAKKKQGPSDDLSINRDWIPGANKGHVEVQITYNLILDLYDKSKELNDEDKKEMLATINELTKHVGKWLVS